MVNQQVKKSNLQFEQNSVSCSNKQINQKVEAYQEYFYLQCVSMYSLKNEVWMTPAEWSG